MSDPVSAARGAREKLRQGLAALQAPGVPADVVQAAEPVAQAMGALHQIEASGGAALAQHAPVALEAVRRALGLLQAHPASAPAVHQALEAVAGSLGMVHQLSQNVLIANAPTQMQQPSPVHAQPAAGGQFHQPGQPQAWGTGAQPAAVQPSAPQQPAQYYQQQPQPGYPQHQAAHQPPPPHQYQQPAPQAYQPPPQPVQPTAHRQPMQQSPAQPQPAPHAYPAGHAQGGFGAPQAQPAAAQFGVPPAQAPAQWQPADPAASAPAAQASAAAGPAAIAGGGTLQVDAELGAHSATNFYKGLSGNDVIDSGGIFIATYQIPEIGQQLLIKVSLPGGYEFEANGVVRWTREAPHSNRGAEAPPGFGAQFTNISQEGRQLVYRYVRNREPLFHDDL